MLRSYLAVVLRGLRRHEGFTFINVAGLAAGTACCLFILVFVRDELSCDRRHEKADRIYRLAVAFRPPLRGDGAPAPCRQASAPGNQTCVPGN